MTTALITGSAGFIGYHAAKRWLEQGWQVVGLDSFSSYYAPQLKRDRAAMLAEYPGYTEVEGKVETPGLLMDLFAAHRPTHVVHLAAQAGVRYSIEAPRTYLEANIQGTFELLEAARAHPAAHLLLASTSSAYGTNKKMPYAETDKADAQVSFYAATKKATEAMAHSYAHLYDLPVTMFRFFTVYGPWGRPDMAPMKFVKAMLNGDAIDVYNHGQMRRDFTYIDDLIEAIWRLAKKRPERDAPVGDFDSLSPVAPFRIVNIGKAQPDSLGEFIAQIEQAVGFEAKKNMMPMQPGDVPATWSDTRLLEALSGYKATTSLADGIPEFVAWYRRYYDL
ncbi:MAG: NAD-dependent epimerase/dehydratase family protein [Paracoccaceae bacterium]